MTNDIIESIAQQWDGCMYDAPGEEIDIGAAIRNAARGAAKAAPVEAAVQPGVLTVAARYFDWLQEHNRGTSFSTFVDEFGYQERDCKLVYEVVVLPCLYAARRAAEQKGTNDDRK